MALDLALSRRSGNLKRKELLSRAFELLQTVDGDLEAEALETSEELRPGQSGMPG